MHHAAMSFDKKGMRQMQRIQTLLGFCGIPSSQVYEKIPSGMKILLFTVKQDWSENFLMASSNQTGRGES